MSASLGWLDLLPLDTTFDYLLHDGWPGAFAWGARRAPASNHPGSGAFEGSCGGAGSLLGLRLPGETVSGEGKAADPQRPAEDINGQA
jgi:hypothetical protein